MVNKWIGHNVQLSLLLTECYDLLFDAYYQRKCISHSELVLDDVI